jgi:hypothetical protein
MTNTEYVKERIAYYEYFREYYRTRIDKIAIPCAPSPEEVEHYITIYISILKILEDRNAGQWR